MRAAALSVSYALCVSKGSDSQELKACATDALQRATLTPGNFGNWYRLTATGTVHVFYCSDNATLAGPPLKCVSR